VNTIYFPNANPYELHFLHEYNKVPNYSVSNIDLLFPYALPKKNFFFFFFDPKKNFFIMPAKITAICFVHKTNERLTQEYTIKKITAVSILDADDPTKSFI
jgi:hypothetical protein